MLVTGLEPPTLSNQLKATLECARCRENHPTTLQFHHCDPQKKDFNLSEAVREGYSIERIKKEVAKCTVLCANCHAKSITSGRGETRSPLVRGWQVNF